VPGSSVRFLAPEFAFPEYSRALLKKASQFPSNVILVFKGMELNPTTLRSLQRSGVRLVNYNSGHPFTLFSRGSGNRNVRRSIRAFDLHLTYSRRIEAEMRDCSTITPPRS
jgi:hypothetical protein